MMRVALFVASVAVAFPGHCLAEFEKYKSAFKKEYKDASEEKHRFKLFCAELKKIGFNGWVTREGGDGGDEKTAALMDELLDL